MPYLHLHTNVRVDDQPAMLRDCSQLASRLLGKPEGYVMVELSDGKPMLFAGSDAPAAFVELTSLGLSTVETEGLSAEICAMLTDVLSIDPARIYIQFAAPERAMFGWNGGTF